ncbi:unnamed protein product [Auanema sp. JU1783]|nr:unnamed protein product [Auanema sp. JU1783]
MSSMKLLFRKTEVDLGNGRCLFAWRPLRNSIAVAGANRSVYLYERRGELIDVLELTAKIIGISWDCEGDVLAIITEGTSQLLLWDYNTKQADVVDISMGSREVASCITWSNNSPVLALGTHNGNLFIYNHRTARKIPSIGKHQRKVTGIVITRQDQIVSCAEDNTVIVSSCDGETVNTYPVSGSPSQLAVGEIKKGNGSTEIIISSVLNNKILFFMPIDNAEAQTNLQFQEKYGNIVSYKWFNEGLMILGFDKGFMVIISAHRSEIGTELNCFAEYKNYLSHTTTNDVFQYIINIGDNQIRIRDMEQGQDLQLMTDIETDKELDKVECSSDGQLVCVSSVSGAVSVYLTRMPVLTAARGDIIAILTSLSQITVHREGDRNKTRVIEAAVEPTLIAVGPLYAAVATNNKIWFYEYPNSNTGQLVRECEYLSTIVSVSLNTDYAAVVMEGKARLHKILDRDDEISITFPEPSRNTRLISACLTTHFLIFTTETNYIIYFSLEEWSVVSEYRHSSSIRHIAPDSTGLRCCVFDERMDTWVYSPVDDSMLKLPPVGPSVLYTSALWETFTIDRNTFIVFDTNNVYVFLVLKSQVEGESSVFIGTTKLPYGHTPLTLSKGIVQCITSGGKVSGVLLESHRTDTILESKKIEEAV